MSDIIDMEVYGPKALICVSDELKEHYDKIIDTRDSILGSGESSGGEKAAIINATTTALKELVKLQQSAYNADMLSRLQQAIFNALKDSPAGVQERVMELLEQHLEGVE